VGVGLRPFSGVIKYAWGMLDIRSKQILGTVTLVAVGAVTLVVAPYTLLDPINLPKLCVLSFFAIVALALYVPALKSLFTSKFKTLLIVTLLFLLQMFLVLIFSGTTMIAQIYGTHGRNTGTLAYASLALLMVGSSLIADKEFLIRFVKVALFIGLILIVYGNLQYLNLDPLPFKTIYTANAPVGTLGNPDFQSAFMGIMAVLFLTLAINAAFQLRTRLVLALMGLISIVVIYETIAKQGYFAFIAGAGVVAILWFFMTKRKALGTAAAGIGIAAGGLVSLGLINAGPLASYLYKGSLEARGFYWRAAAKMLIDHPFFGVGMDGYFNWYRRSRDSDYVAKHFYSYSNAAHNVYLDIASNGGFPLIIIYCTIIALVIFSIVRVVKRSEGFDVYFVAIVGAWVAYQVQSLISINQLGLAIWGWVLSGLIIGYEIHTRVQESTSVLPKSGKPIRKSTKISTAPLSSATVMRLFGGVILGAMMAIPPYYANATYFSALKVFDVKTMQISANLKPVDEYRLLHAATMFRDNNYDAQAVEILRDAVVRFPDSFDLWMVWATLPSAAPGDAAHAVAELQRLDPYNPDVTCWKCVG
jgi:O-antigen ligase